MRRSFPRTPSSPQASVTVETPAHYAPTPLLLIGSLSEVVIGSVEPTMSCVSCETRCKYMKILPIIQRKRTKSYAFMVFWAEQYAFGDDSTWEQGKRYGQTGSETACNREKYGMSLNSIARPHKCGRAPLYFGAPALICWSGRSKPNFIL